jgi:hypothetical protein
MYDERDQAFTAFCSQRNADYAHKLQLTLRCREIALRWVFSGEGRQARRRDSCQLGRGRAAWDCYGSHRPEGLPKARLIGHESNFQYDRNADILHMHICSPHTERESEELGHEVILRTPYG